MSSQADVVVVGAGLAGLVTARRLERAGLSVIVLEARERVGGRTLAAPIGGGEVVEIGGQWVGPGQDRIATLIAELGLETFPTWDRGRSVLELDGRRKTYSGTIPRLGPLVLLDIALARHRLQKLASRVDTSAPWLSPDAAELDAISFGDWLAGGMRTEPARQMLRIACRTVWGAEPDDFSLLHALFYIASAGGLDPLLDVEGGAQELRIVGGSQLIAERMAEELREGPRLGAPVEAIRTGASGDAEVTLAGGDSIRARRVVVAVPTPLRGEIDFDPPLGAAHHAVPSAAVFGSLIKCVAVFDEPFWRDEGFSGEALSDLGPATLTFDNSPPGGRPGVLLGFVGGNDARALAEYPAAERRKQVLAGFARIFGERASRPDDYIEQDWSAERWSAGGPTFVLPPGGWSAAGPGLREPVGPVHWAGSETAERWAGFMDGAVRSGERVADEISSALGC